MQPTAAPHPRSLPAGWGPCPCRGAGGRVARPWATAGRCRFGRKPLPGRSAPARRASACKAPSGSAPAMPAVPGLRSSPRASSPGGSARLTAWRLFIRRQRQRELLADAGAFVLPGSSLVASWAAPHHPPPPNPPRGSSFRLCAPTHHPNPWRHRRGPNPDAHRATAGLVTRLRHEGMPDGCHHPRHPSASPAARPRVWRWHPKGGWGQEERVGTQPWASPLSTVPAEVGGASPKRGPPLGRYQEKRWQPALARGQAREGGCPRAPRGREQSLGISFLAGPGCPPLPLPPTPPSPPPALGRGDTIKSVFC